MSQKKETNEPLCIIYTNAKTSMTLAVRNIMKAFPLPIFMIEGILEGILMEIRGEGKMELSSEVQKYKNEMEKKEGENK